MLLLLLCGCKKQPSPTVFVDPALATLVPADAVLIAGIHVEQLQAQGKTLIEEFARKTGLDLRKDLWEVVVAFDGKTSWVMLRGKFTEMGMEPRINREGAKRMGYKGYTMLGDEALAVMFLNPTTAVVSSFDALKQIVDNRDKGTGMPKWLQEKVKAIPSTNQVWFAGDVSQIIPGSGIATGGADLRQGGARPLRGDSKGSTVTDDLLAEIVRLVSAWQEQESRRRD